MRSCAIQGYASGSAAAWPPTMRGCALGSGSFSAAHGHSQQGEQRRARSASNDLKLVGRLPEESSPRSARLPSPGCCSAAAEAPAHARCQTACRGAAGTCRSIQQRCWDTRPCTWTSAAPAKAIVHCEAGASRAPCSVDAYSALPAAIHTCEHSRTAATTTHGDLICALLAQVRHTLSYGCRGGRPRRSAYTR